MRLFFVLLTLAFTSIIIAQPKEKKLLDSLMSQGQHLLDNSLHEESIRVYKQVKEISIDLDSMETFFTADNRIIQNLWRLNRLEEAEEQASEILPQVLNHFGSDHKIVGETYLQKGVISMFQGENSEAIRYFKEVERINRRLGKEGLSGLSAVYVNMGYIYVQIGNFEEMLKNYKKAYEIDKKLYGNDHLFVAEDLSNLAAVYINKGMNSQAIEYLQEAKDILVKLNNTGSQYALVLINLGKAFVLTNQFKKGHDYLNEAIQVYANLFGEKSALMVPAYHSISTGFSEKENFDSSLYYLKKCLVFEEEYRKSDAYSQVFIYRDIARCYSELGDLETALDYNDKAVKLVDETSRSSDLYGILFDNRSIIYSRFKAYDKAINYLKTAISNYAEESRSYLFASWRNLALVYRKNGDFDKALVALQESMKFNHLDWNYESVYENPSPDGVIDQEDFFDALDIKAEVLSELYKKNSSQQLLDAALDTYDLLSKSIVDQRTDFSRIQDKIDLGSYTHRIYSGAIELNYHGYLNTESEEYLQNCFYYSELDKSITLSEVINDRAILKELLPKEIIDLEQDLRYNISNYHSALLTELDSSKVDLYHDRLFALKRQKDSLLSYIKNNHKDLFETRYHSSVLSIPKIQSRLESTSAILEYFVGDSTTYGFLITKTSFELRKVGKSDSLISLIKKYTSSIENTTAMSIDLLSYGSLLYDQLILPFEKVLANEFINDLIIVPSGATHFIPFDLLIKSSKDGSPKNFKEADYLIKHYSVRTNYSVNSRGQNNSRIYAPKVLAFAPSYNDIQDTNRLEQLAQFRDVYTPLQWNDDEISAISSFFSSEENKGISATEKNFKLKAKEFNILHLAMHAFVDNDDPMKSKFVFTNSGDSIEDNLLHTFELFNMDLEANLAILSACRTGKGKLVNGEGVISLAKGFSYAGVQNVIMSHWQVDDESTSRLMAHYYELLADGVGKSEALRLAKLNFLKGASPNKSHPFFWGAFVLIGDNSPIVSTKNHITIVLFSILLLLIVFYFFKKRFS